MNNTLLIIVVIVTAILAVSVSGVIFFLIIKQYLKNERKKAAVVAENEQKKMMLQMKIDEHKESLKVVTPIRLQAYERMALYLERISPNSLIMRCYKPGMDLKLMQGVMTKTIRDEWEHNLSQQVYLSSESWSRIREAKEEMINLVNSSAVNLPVDADVSSLAGAIFQSCAKSQIPTDAALEFLKKEIKEHFD